MLMDKSAKVILAVIAINLTIITLKELNLLPVAYGSDTIEDQNELMNSNTRYGLVPLNEDGSIDVKISSSGTMDVNIVDVSTSSNLSVEIDDVDPYAFKYCRFPVPVEIKSK